MSGTIFFGSATRAAKRRKRMPGTNKDTSPELKKCNWMYSNYSTVDFRFDYSSYNIDVKYATAALATSGPTWHLYKLAWPAIGTASYEKIGEKIFCKYARFKGYVCTYACCDFPIRWRMVMARLQDFDFGDSMNDYQKLHKLYDNLEDWTSKSGPLTINASLRHSFYKKVKRTDTNDWAKIKVIASGVLPNYDSKKYISATVSSNAAYTTYANHSSDTMTAQFPIDVKVKLNDCVDHTVSYYIWIEVDNTLGWKFDTTASTPPVDLVPRNDGSVVPARFSFFSRLYYYDY